MNAADLPLADTWGRRLSREAQRLMARRMPGLPWLRQMAPLLQRIRTLPTPDEDRFRRIEAVGPQRFVQSVVVPLVHDEALPLPSLVRQQLAPFPAPALEEVRVHTGPRADAIAREHSAEAVAAGRDIYFRRYRYRPEEQAGLALLAHELEHVLAALRPDAAWRRATARGLQEEEDLALTRERQVLGAEGAGSTGSQVAASTDLPLRSAMPQPVVPATPGTTPLHQPMAAEVGRDLGERSPAQERSPTNLETLRRELYRDLMQQIRADLERGA